jgi:peptidoglycan-associated lipoprotein
MKKVSSVFVVILAVTMVMGMMSGCKHKKPIEVLDTNLDDNGLDSDINKSGDGLPTVDLNNLQFESGSKYGLQTVLFDYNSSTLRSDAMATLRANVENIKKVSGKVIQLAGHCDSRGTQEYNLALGERRALAVREYLIQLGVPGNSLITISYGKEFPAVSGESEEAWSKNRRVEFNVAR